MISVIVHYIYHSYTVQTRLTALRDLHDFYNDENVANLVVKIINEYEFADRLVYFTLDNVSLNDICVNEFFIFVRSDIFSRERPKRRLCY